MVVLKQWWKKTETVADEHVSQSSSCKACTRSRMNWRGLVVQTEDGSYDGHQVPSHPWRRRL